EAVRAVVRPDESAAQGTLVRLVVHPQPLLLFHRLPLVLEVLLGHGEGAHPVRLEPERQIQAVGGQCLVIVRVVIVGRAILVTAGALHVLEMLGLPDVRRPLKHHVLEEVGESGHLGALVAGTDAVPEVHRDHRCLMLLGIEHLETVGEAEGVDGDGTDDLLCRRRCARRGGQESDGQGKGKPCDTHWSALPRKKRLLGTAQVRWGTAGNSASGLVSRIARFWSSGSDKPRNWSMFCFRSFTPGLGQSVPHTVFPKISPRRGKYSRSFAGGIPETSNHTFL